MRAKPGVYSLGGAGSPKALLKRRACVAIYKHFPTKRRRPRYCACEMPTEEKYPSEVLLLVPACIEMGTVVISVLWLFL